MKVKEFIETYCDEDELFVVEHDGRVIRKFWISDYRRNKDSYKDVLCLDIISWYVDYDRIGIIV